MQGIDDHVVCPCSCAGSAPCQIMQAGHAVSLHCAWSFVCFPLHPHRLLGQQHHHWRWTVYLDLTHLTAARILITFVQVTSLPYWTSAQRCQGIGGARLCCCLLLCTPTWASLPLSVLPTPSQWASGNVHSFIH